MDDEEETQRLMRAARSHRARAALARHEAADPALEPWRRRLLLQSIAYYEGRARDADRQLRRLSEGGGEPPPPGGEQP